MTKTFKVTIVRNGSICYIPLTFDPKPVFGKLRAPVTVTLNGYTFRSTIAAMGGRRVFRSGGVIARRPGSRAPKLSTCASISTPRRAS